MLHPSVTEWRSQNQNLEDRLSERLISREFRELQMENPIGSVQKEGHRGLPSPELKAIT